MTLDDCYSQHKGTAVLVPGGGTGNNGQCEQWADLVLHDVFGLPYIYTPSAKDWWYDFDKFPQLKNNFDRIGKDQPPKKDDYIIYDPLSANDPQGHVDTVSRDGGTLQDFWAYDSNWDARTFHDAAGYPTLHEVHHNDIFNEKIIGYIRKKGGSTIMKPTQQQVTDEFAKFGASPNQQQLSYYQSKTIDVLYADLINGNCPSAQTVKDLFKSLANANPSQAQVDFYTKKEISILYKDLAQPYKPSSYVNAGSVDGKPVFREG